MKNILVFGGAGYIGSHTLKHLIEHGFNCVAADNLIYGHKEAVPPGIPLEQTDLLDPPGLRALFSKYKFDAVIHFAAFAYVGESVTNPQKYYVNNVIGTINLLSAMLEAGVMDIVFSSTCATYGEPEYTPIDEKHPQNPINPYGTTKLMIEKVLADFENAYGFRWIALRYFNAAGAGKDIGESHNPETHLIPLVLQAIKDGKTVFLSSHILSEVESLCNKMSIIRQGVIVDSGTLADMRQLTRTGFVVKTDNPLTGVNIPGIHDLRQKGEEWHFMADGNAVRQVMEVIAPLGIQSINASPPSLEELFMRHYDTAGGGTQ